MKAEEPKEEEEKEERGGGEPRECEMKEGEGWREGEGVGR